MGLTTERRITETLLNMIKAESKLLLVKVLKRLCEQDRQPIHTEAQEVAYRLVSGRTHDRQCSGDPDRQYQLSTDRLERLG